MLCRVNLFLDIFSFFSKSEKKSTAEGIKCLKAFINNRVSVNHVVVACNMFHADVKFPVIIFTYLALVTSS